MYLEEREHQEQRHEKPYTGSGMLISLVGAEG